MVNECCHSSPGRVLPNDIHIMRSPRVLPILWGNYYVDPDVVTEVRLLLTDLVTGRFMNGLAQYGVRRGSMLNPITIPVIGNDPNGLTRIDVQNQLTTWINNGTVAPPAVNEQNLLYVIFLPTGSTISEPGYAYHTSARYRTTGGRAPPFNNLFFATILTNPTLVPQAADTTTGRLFARSLAYIVSHELNEAFTDRDFRGFSVDISCTIAGRTVTDFCEIGDNCEFFGGTGTGVTTFSYGFRAWQIEWYWSNWDMNCIRGDQPVSIKKFLETIGVNGSKGLRQLRTNRINVDYVADSVASHMGI
jgi:hypothetical protein